MRLLIWVVKDPIWDDCRASCHFISLMTLSILYYDTNIMPDKGILETYPRQFLKLWVTSVTT
jgi:hypothetical protein